MKFPITIHPDVGMMAVHLPLNYGMRVDYYHLHNPPAPWVRYPGYGTVCVLEDDADLGRVLEETFGGCCKVATHLGKGNMAEAKDGSKWLAICAVKGVWHVAGHPDADRAIAALWSPVADLTPQYRDGEAMKITLRAHLEHFNLWLTGGIYGCRVTLRRPSGSWVSDLGEASPLYGMGAVREEVESHLQESFALLLEDFRTKILADQKRAERIILSAEDGIQWP